MLGRLPLVTTGLRQLTTGLKALTIGACWVESPELSNGVVSSVLVVQVQVRKRGRPSSASCPKEVGNLLLLRIMLRKEKRPEGCSCARTG